MNKNQVQQMTALVNKRRRRSGSVRSSQITRHRTIGFLNARGKLVAEYDWFFSSIVFYDEWDEWSLEVQWPRRQRR